MRFTTPTKRAAMGRFRRWLSHKWQAPDLRLIESYRATFNGEHGQRVLNDMIDSCYATVCNSDDPMALAAHNARRRFVHEILQSLDQAENPAKYEVRVEASDGLAR